jgi:hypothetical protein
VQDAALPAGANAIGTVGVTSLPALVASSAAIGKLTANPGVTIGSVDVLTMAALIASSAIIGKVGIDTTTPGTTDRVSSVGTTTILVTPTLASGGAYAIGDFIGPSGGLGIGVNPAARATGGGGVLVGLVMIDGDNQGIPLDVYVFANSNWTSPSDNAAWSLSDSSAKYCVGRVAFNTFVSYGAAGQIGFGTFPEGPIYYQCNGQTLYLAPVTRGTPTYTATPSSTAGIQFRVALQPD